MAKTIENTRTPTISISYNFEGGPQIVGAQRFECESLQLHHTSQGREVDSDFLLDYGQKDDQTLPDGKQFKESVTAKRVRGLPKATKFFLNFIM